METVSSKEEVPKPVPSTSLTIPVECWPKDACSLIVSGERTRKKEMRMQGSKRRFILVTCNTLALICFAFVLWIRVATTTVRGPVVSAQPCQYRTGNTTTGSLLSGTDVTIRSSD